MRAIEQNVTDVAAEVSRLCAAVGATPDTINHADVMLYRHCREGRGDRTALYFDGEIYTYNQVADAAAAGAAWLGARGVEPGDRVIISLPDCATLVAAYFGVVAAGAIAVMLDPGLPMEDAFYVAQLCDARLAIGDVSRLGNLAALQAIPGMLGVVGADRTWTKASAFTDALRMTSGSDRHVGPSVDGRAYGMLTSGSTGRPKLIVHRHQDILHGYVAFARAVLGLTSVDRVVSVAKMTTGYGLGCSLLMPFLEGASTALVSERPAAARIIETIEAHGCSLLFAQPRFLAEMRADTGGRDRLHTLRLVITGGEPLSSALAERWTRLSDAELIDSYGSTEVGFLFISNRPGDAKSGSVGRPIEGLQVEVVDETGRMIAPEQIGRLRVRGPMVIGGYWNDPQRSEAFFRDGWFTTSDMVSTDQQGYWYIHGRADHLIKLGCGDWVNPIELEMTLLEHPDVRECAVVGGPDADGLTALRAVVVLHEPAAASNDLAAALSDRIRDRWPLQTYKRLFFVGFAASLPKTTAGKLDRARLRPQSMTEFSYKC